MYTTLFGEYSSPWILEKFEIFDIAKAFSKSEKYFSKGSYIYQQGESIKHLYLLKQGKINVGTLSFDGQEKTLSIQNSGHFFGESAFFDKNPSFTFAKAMMDCTVVSFDADDVQKLFQYNAEIPVQLFTSIARKMRLLTFQVEYLSFMSLEKRMLALLLSMPKTHVSECPNRTVHDNMCCNSFSCQDSIVICEIITDEDLGHLLAARREAVTKAISKLRKMKLIEKRQRRLCIPSMERVQAFLNGEE